MSETRRSVVATPARRMPSETALAKSPANKLAVKSRKKPLRSDAAPSAAALSNPPRKNTRRRSRDQVPATFRREMARVSSTLEGCLRLEMNMRPSSSSEITFTLRASKGVVTLRPSTPLTGAVQRCIDRVADRLHFDEATFTSTYKMKRREP
jgi:hypothetical protein